MLKLYERMPRPMVNRWLGFWWPIRCATGFHPWVGRLRNNVHEPVWFECLMCEKRWDAEPRLASVL